MAMDLIFVGVRGTVVALDRTTGSEQWRTPLRGSDFVNVVREGNEVLASTKGEIYSLDAATGSVRWHNPLKGLGYGFVSIAGASGQEVIAAADKRRRQQQAAAASAGR